MPCTQQQFLFDQYLVALQMHRENLNKVCDLIGCIPHVEFEALWRSVVYTRELLEQARTVSQNHPREHGCEVF